MANLFGCGGMSELHGASIQVTTAESTLIGKACDLKLGNVIIQSKVFNASGAVLFTDIQEVGEYTVYASDGVDSTSETVIVTAEDIVSKSVLELEIAFSAPLPIASRGEVIQIGGKNCMCIGTNRYLYMYSLDKLAWNPAVTAVQNWAVPTEISSLYNVSSKALITKDEAEALTQAQRKAIYDAVFGATGEGVWTGTETGANNQAYCFYSNGGIDTNTKNSSYFATLPAFTISRK